MKKCKFTQWQHRRSDRLSLCTTLASGGCLVLVLVIAVPARADVFAFPEALNKLASSTYSLTTTMTVITKNRTRSTIDEFYSAWQQRTRLHHQVWSFETDVIGGGGIVSDEMIFADENQVLRYNPRDSSRGESCKHWTHNEANKLFTQDIPGSAYTGPASLIGPSRIFQFIASNLNNLEFIPVSKSDSDPTVRLIDNRVKLLYKLPGGDSISLFYSNDPAFNLAHGVPPEVHLQAGSVQVIYLFERVRLLANNDFIDHSDVWSVDESFARHRTQSMHYEGGGGNSVASHDLFSVPRASGCSSVLSQNQHDDKLDLVGLEREHYRFSFTAKPQVSGIRGPIELAVGYEPTLETLRVDRTSTSRLAESTLNFARNERHHVVKRRNQLADRMLDKILLTIKPLMVSDAGSGPESSGSEESTSGAQDKIDENISCIKTSLPTDLDRKLGTILFGARQFTYLGRARVRGIDALAFEAEGGKWPAWFQSPAGYIVPGQSPYQNERPVERPLAGFVAANEFHLTTVIYLTTGEPQLATNSSANKKNKFDEIRKAKSDFQDPINSNNKLLLMELIKFDVKNQKRQRLGEVLIPVYDFSWHIPTGGLGNQRFIDFFSLGDDCPASATTRPGRMDVRLALSQAPPLEVDQKIWLSNGPRRDLALLSAFADRTELATTDFYDLISRLDHKSDGRVPSGAGSRLGIGVSFRLWRHVRAAQELVFLGTGSLKSAYTAKFARFLVFDFHACHMVAAHFKLETIFLYESRTQLCLIYAGRLGGSVKLLLGTTTKPDSRGPLEMYQIQQTTEPGRKSSLLAPPPLKQANIRLRPLQLLKLVPVADNGHEDVQRPSPIMFQIEKSRLVFDLESEDSSGMTAATTTTTGDPSLQSISGSFRELAGLGLVADPSATPGMSTLVRPEQLPEEDRLMGPDHLRLLQSAMTLGKCRSVCLASAECRAFSVCSRPAQQQVECVLTSANFRDERLLGLLRAIDTKRMRFGETFALSSPADNGNNGTSVVVLQKYPTCELHTKNFMDLLDEQGEFQVSARMDLREFELAPGGREECAQRCFESTLAIMRDEARRPMGRHNRMTLQQLGKNDVNLHRLFNEHASSNADVCLKFLYLDPADNAALVAALSLPPATRAPSSASSSLSSSEVAESEPVVGYCKIVRRDERARDRKGKQVVDGSGEQQEERPKQQVYLEGHVMNFGLMYDKHFGISLIESEMTTPEKAAFAAIHSEGWEFSESELHNYELIERFVERGDNKILVLLDQNPDNCAKYCFLQIYRSWPACKSFGVIETYHDAGDGFVHQTPIRTCHLHSVTLRETMLNGRYDLIRDRKSQSNQTYAAGQAPAANGGDGGGGSGGGGARRSFVYWHYEPQENLIAGSVDWSAEEGRLRVVRAARRPAGRWLLRLSPLALLVCVLSTLLLGVYSGLNLGKRYQRQLATVQEDRESLVINSGEMEAASGPGASVRIEFENLAICRELRKDGDSDGELKP